MRIRVAALQPGSPDLAECLALVAQAAARGADFALLPETCLGGAQPEPPGGPRTEAFAEAAARGGIALAVPLLALDGTGALRNRALVFDRNGHSLGCYDKVHCTQGERQSGVVPGDAWPVFDMGGWRLGILICHDLSFPEAARILRLRGADVLAWPHVQSGWGEVAWEAVLRARAIDQGVPLVCASFGRPPDRAWRPGQMIGRSGVVGADGLTLADAGRYPGLTLADLDLGLPLLKHDFTRGGEHPFWPDVLADRRPETYGRLSER